MPIRSIDELRNWAGPDWKSASDEDLISMYSRVAKVAPTEVAMTLGYDPGSGGISAKQLSSSVDRYQAGLYGVGEAVTGAIGLNKASGWLAEQRRANELQADVASARAREMGAVDTWKDVKDVGDFGSYAKSLAIQSLPYAGEAIVGGMAARGLMSGTRAALTGAKTVEEAAAAKKALDLGSTAGGMAASYPSAVGDILSNQREQAGGKTDLLAAGALGVPYVAFNALGVDSALMRGGVFRNTINLLDRPGGLLGAAARTVATGTGVALKEGISETGQEVINQAGRMAVDPNATLTDPEAIERYKESFAGGATLGGIMGGGLGGWRRSAPATNEIQQAFDQPNVSGTPTTNVAPPPAPPAPQQNVPAVVGGTTDIAQAQQQAQIDNQAAQIQQQQAEQAQAIQAQRDSIASYFGAEPAIENGKLVGGTIFGKSYADPEKFNAELDKLAQNESVKTETRRAVEKAYMDSLPPEKRKLNTIQSGALQFWANKPDIAAAAAAINEAMSELVVKGKGIDDPKVTQFAQMYEALTGTEAPAYDAATKVKPKGAKDGKLPVQTTTGLGAVSVKGGSAETNAGVDGNVQSGGVQSLGTGGLPEGSLGLQVGQPSGEGIRTGTGAVSNAVDSNAPSQVTAKPSPETNQLLRQIFGEANEITEITNPATSGQALRAARASVRTFDEFKQAKEPAVVTAASEGVGGARQYEIPTQYYNTDIMHISPERRGEIILQLFRDALAPQIETEAGLTAEDRLEIVTLSLMEGMTAPAIAAELSTDERTVSGDAVQKQRQRLGITETQWGLSIDQSKPAGRSFMASLLSASESFKSAEFPDGLSAAEVGGLYSAKDLYYSKNKLYHSGVPVVEETEQRTVNNDIKLQEELYKNQEGAEATQSAGEIKTAGGAQGNIDSLKQSRKGVLDMGALAQINALEQEADTLRNAIEEMAPKDPRLTALQDRLEAIGDINKGELGDLWAQYAKSQALRTKSDKARNVAVVAEEEAATTEELTGEEIAASEREDERKKEAAEKAAADEPETAKVEKTAKKTKAKAAPKPVVEPEQINEAEVAKRKKVVDEARAKAAAERNGLEVGDTVVNPKLGTGEVVSFAGNGDDTRVTVKFQSGQTKELLVKSAKLEKTNAVQVQSANERDVREPTGGSETVGKGNAKSEKTAGEAETKSEIQEIKTPAEEWADISKLAPELPSYDLLAKSEKTRWDDLVRRGQANLAAAVKIVGEKPQPAGEVLADEKPEATSTDGSSEAVTAENEIPAPKPILFSKTNETVQVTQAPDLVNNGRTLDLVVDGKVTKTYDLVSQGLWDAFKGRSEAQENLLQSAAARKVKDEANQALKKANWVYSEQAPLSRVENEAIQALANNDTSMIKRIVSNVTIRDSVLRMLSSALSFPGQPYSGFKDLAAMSKDDPRARLTAENILRYAPEYMLKNANIPAEFKFSKTGTPATSQNSVYNIWNTLLKLFDVAPADSAYKDFIRVSQTAKEAYEAAGKKVPLAQLQNAQAFIDPTDDRIVHLIADNIAKGSELAVLLHEVGVHVGLKKKLGANFKILESQVKAWANSPKGSLERQVYERAMARVAAARMDGAISADIAAEELVAYAAEEAALAGVKVKDAPRSRLEVWVKQLHDIASQAFKRFFKINNVPELSVQDLVNFSFAAAQEHLQAHRSEIGATVNATESQIAKYYAGARGTYEGTSVVENEDRPGPGEESFFWSPADKFGSFTEIGTRGFYSPANPSGAGPRGVGAPEYAAMVVTSAESRAFGDEQKNNQDKVLLTFQATRDRQTNIWSLIVSGPDIDSALYVDLYVEGLATTTKDNEGNEWSRLEGISGRDNLRLLGEFRRRLTRMKNGEIPNIDFVRVTGSGAAKEDGRPGVYAADTLATRFSKAPTADQVTSALPGALQKSARARWTNIKSLVNRGLYASAITEDLAGMAKKYMPSVSKYLQAQYNRQATRLSFERRIEDILAAFDKLPQNLQGEGKNSVNAYIYDSTREKKWGYYPGEHQVGTKLFEIDPDFKERFDAFPPAAQKLIKDVFQHGYEALKMKQNAAVAAVEREFVEREKNAGSDADLQQAIAKEKKQMLKRISSLHSVNVGNPYAYLGRYGDYVVTAKSAEFKAYEEAAEGNQGRVNPDYITGDSQQAKNWLQDHVNDPTHYVVEFAETQGEADAIAADLIATGQYDLVDSDAHEKEANASYSGGYDLYLGVKGLRTYIEKKEGAKIDPKLDRAIGNLYLMLVAESSARQRKNVAGASKNMMRNLATSGRADAHFLASMEHSDAINESLAAMQREARRGDNRAAMPIYNELYTRHANSLDYEQTGTLSTALTRMTTLWTLSMNPAYYLQQLLQTMVFSLPYMSGRLGYFRSARALKRAYGDMAELVKGLGVNEHINFDKAPEDVRFMLKQLVAMGKIDLGIDAESKARADEQGALGKTMLKLQGINTRIESINRATAAIAAYRAYTDRYKGATGADGVRFAADVVSNTHGSYDAFNTPRVLQGDVARVALQFKRFQIIQLSMLAKLIHTSFKGASKEEKAIARASLSYITAHMAVLGGALGVPFVSQAAWIISKLFGDEDEPDNFEYKLRRMIGDDAVADLLLRGVPAAVGLESLGKKLSMENVASPFGPFVEPDLTSRAGAEKMLVGVMGPAANLGLKFTDALGLMTKGNYYKGLELALPNGVANFMKGIRFKNEGITMRNGDLVMKPEDISMIDAAFQAVGLPTSTITDRQYTQKVVAEFDKFYAEQSKDIKAAYVEGSRANDSAAMAEAREDWKKLQESRVRNGYKRQPPTELFRAPYEARKRERSVVGGVETTKSNRRFVELQTSSF